MSNVNVQQHKFIAKAGMTIEDVKNSKEATALQKKYVSAFDTDGIKGLSQKEAALFNATTFSEKADGTVIFWTKQNDGTKVGTKFNINDSNISFRGDAELSQEIAKLDSIREAKIQENKKQIQENKKQEKINEVKSQLSSAKSMLTRIESRLKQEKVSYSEFAEDFHTTITEVKEISESTAIIGSAGAFFSAIGFFAVEDGSALFLATGALGVAGLVIGGAVLLGAAGYMLYKDRTGANDENEQKAIRDAYKQKYTEVSNEIKQLENKLSKLTK